MCQLQMGLAILPTDGWTYIRNIKGKHVGYITTLPMKVEDLKGCVLTVNTETGDAGYLLAELLDGQSDDCISGYEMDNCDKIDQSGTGQVVSTAVCGGAWAMAARLCSWLAYKSAPISTNSGWTPAGGHSR